MRRFDTSLGNRLLLHAPPFLHYCVLWHVPPYIPPLPGIFSTLSSSNSLSFPFFSRASPPVTQSQRTHLRPHVQRYDWLFTSTPQPRPYASICTTNDERQGSESLLAARAGGLKEGVDRRDRLRREAETKQGDWAFKSRILKRWTPGHQL
ncbi:hypothetical protein CCUS01_09861 [Colletotrichum cuscutae]|uniref:Uncharacterized protein n=1 Tax=Colletotrichum cuscutae TaxID=1209917 RepID=A0AAI9XNT5_9PEZI|nr:hypothetical protein CCUS01_09861 [Colletotrichum cuscutae]